MHEVPRSKHRLVAVCGILTGLILAVAVRFVEPATRDVRAGRAPDERSRLLRARLGGAPDEAFAAALLLYRAKDPAGTAHLLALLEGPDANGLRDRALRAFVEADDRDVVPVLRRLRDRADAPWGERIDGALRRLVHDGPPSPRGG